MDVEYTTCLVQVGQDSLSAKTHRQRGGNPRLTINVGPNNVEWVLENLFDGNPEVVQNPPRRDRVDFYFLLDTFRQDRAQLPLPAAQPTPSLRLPTTNSAGTERPGGRRVRMDRPISRYLIASTEMRSAHQPSFQATARGPVHLHLDIEYTPLGMYPQRLLEVHLGIQASYDILLGYAGAQNQAVIGMSHATYATIFEDLHNL